jgi:hypothetical protein
MALVFPKDPYAGIIYSAGESRWTWDGTAWNLLPPDSVSYNEIILTPREEPNSVEEGKIAVANGTDWDPDLDGDPKLMVYLDDEWQVVNTGEAYTLPTASPSVLGGVKVDGVSVIIDDDGIITALSGAEVTLTNGFETIAVAGQSNVVAESATDTLTLTAGTGISITTDASTDTITITNTGSGSNTFGTIAVAGQSNVVADSTIDTLTIAAGTGISITTDASTDTITITNTVNISSINFADLNEIDTAALTVDRIYLPAITMLTVTNSGALAYRFDQYGSDNNPTIYAINGTTIAFNLQVAGHPFLIQTAAGNNYNTGLVHVSTTGVVTTGINAQGKTSGTLYWKVPIDIFGGYRYQCSIHAPMVGSLFIKNFNSI